jgi:outer membrane protein assembly factor BamA
MVIAAALALLVAAQPNAQDTERLAGLTIEKIEVIAAPSENKDELLALTGLSVGAAYVASDARRAVELLYQLGRFANVYVFAARVENGVYLRFELPPRPRVRDVKVIGNDQLSSSEIEDAIELHTGSEVDPRSFKQKREMIAAKLERLGYRSPAIGIAAEPAGPNGAFDVVIRIDEGPRTRLSELRIQGHPERPLPGLAQEIGFKHGDVLNLNEVDLALERIAAGYRKRGYLEVEIDEPIVKELARSENAEPLADLIVHIEAGPLIRILFEGHRAVSIRELKEAAAILADKTVGAGPSALKEVETRILALYERRGYWQAIVKTHVRTSSEGKKKIITFAIDEGQSSYIASLRFPGNKSVSEDTLRDKVLEIVESTLAEDVGRPGMDAKTLDQIAGDATSERKTTSPDNSAPNVREIYVARAYSAAADAVADLYRAEGFQNVEVEQAKPQARRKDSTLLDVSMGIKEGVRWMIGALSFTGNESVSSRKLLELCDLDPGRKGGEPLSFYKVDEASRSILAHYRNEGYLYARVSEDLREVPQRGSVAAEDFVHTSSAAPLDIQRLCARAIAEDRPTCEVQLVFRVFEGPQVHARQIVVRGVESTSENLVRSEIAFKEGEILRDSDILNTRTNLLRYGVFERIDVHPIDEQVIAPEKDVVVEVRERKAWSAEVGAGISTEEGARVFGSISQANLFGTALRFQSNAKVYYNPFVFLYSDQLGPPTMTFPGGSPSQQQLIENFYSTIHGINKLQGTIAAGLTYPQIYSAPRGLGAGLDVSLNHHYEPVYAEDSATLSLSTNYKGFRPIILGQQRPVTFTVRSSLEYVVLNCNEQILNSVKSATVTGNICSADQHSARGTTVYGLIGPTLRWDLTDDPLNPSSGVFAELSGDYGAGLVHDSPDFVRLEGKVNVFVPVYRRIGLAFSFHMGRIIQFGSSGQIPLNRRYFAGGASTIRGYPERVLFPQDHPYDATNNPITTGGLVLATLKSELRFPLVGSLSGAIFYDVGDLWENLHNVRINIFNKGPTQLRQGVGFGFRFNTPVGPLAVDLGVPLVLHGDTGEKAAIIPVPHLSLRVF